MSRPNNIVTFAVAADSGKLTPTGAKVDVPKPVQEAGFDMNDGDV